MKQLTKIIGEAVLISPLIVISIFLNLWTECLLIVILLFIYKSFYPLQYHSNKNIICIIISYTAVSLGLLISYIFNKEYILLILIYNIIAYTSAKLGALQRKAQKYELIEQPYKDLVKYYNDLNKTFNANSCTETELINRCKELNFSEENTKLAILFFIKKLKHREIANMYCIEEDSVTKAKYRMKKLLNKVEN